MKKQSLSPLVSMIMPSISVATATIVISTALYACARTSPADASSPTSATVSSDAEPMGTWSFVLDASDVAARVREHCAKESDGDAEKAGACWKEASADASNEKIRFTKDDAGHVIWTSFGTEGGKEDVFVAVPVELVSDGPNAFRVEVRGKPSGTRAEEFERAGIDRLRVERVDAKTIALHDPRKGRLVFSK